MTERADIILFILASVLTLWGLSVAWRGAVGERRGKKRQCRHCGGDPGPSMTCASCGFEAKRERELRARVRSWRLTLLGVAGFTGGLVAIWGGFVVRDWFQTDDGGAGVSPYDAMGVGTLLFACLLGAHGWLGERSKGRKRCPRCWYEMEGVAGRRCPECGREVKDQRALYRPRRRRGQIAVACVIALAGITSTRIEPIVRHGWRGVFPTTLLIAGYEWLPETLVVDDRVGSAPRPWCLEDRHATSQGMWRWQEAWLEQRASRMLRRASDPTGVARSYWLVDADSNAEVALAATSAVVRLMLREDPRQRAAAVELYATSAFDLSRFETSGVIQPEAKHLAAALPNATAPEQDTILSLLSKLKTPPAPAVDFAFQHAFDPARDDSWRGMNYTAALLVSRVIDTSASDRARLAKLATDDAPAARMFMTTAIRFMLVFGDRDRLSPGVRGELANISRSVLDDQDDMVVFRASEALGNLRDDPGHDIPLLLEHARADEEKRYDYLNGLRYFHEDARPFLEEIAAFLEDPDAGVTSQAVWAIFNAVEDDPGLASSWADHVQRVMQGHPDPDAVKDAQLMVEMLRDSPSEE
ncbi:MAG: hypothetical protein R3B57_02490 [Phycisphaerales bacterium]